MNKKALGAQADRSDTAAGKYDDIIDLPRPKMKHARMSMEARAAQFAPFAALVGYESMVQETSEQVIEAVEHETEIVEFPDGVDEVYPDEDFVLK